MGRLVSDLERAGLARREGDAADAKVRVRSTAKGQRVLRRGRELRVSELERRVRRLAAEERTTLAEAVAIIERALRD